MLCLVRVEINSFVLRNLNGLTHYDGQTRWPLSCLLSPGGSSRAKSRQGELRRSMSLLSSRGQLRNLVINSAWWPLSTLNMNGELANILKHICYLYFGQRACNKGLSRVEARRGACDHLQARMQIAGLRVIGIVGVIFWLSRLSLLLLPLHLLLLTTTSS